jgi:hypothetical protein
MILFLRPKNISAVRVDSLFRRNVTEILVTTSRIGILIHPRSFRVNEIALRRALSQVCNCLVPRRAGCLTAAEAFSTVEALYEGT